MNNFLNQLRTAFPSGSVLTGEDIPVRYFSDWMTTAPRGYALALVRPRTTDEVSRLLKLCNEHRVAVVPQGGLTGLAGGAQPVKACVLISMELMKAIEEVDLASSTVTVEAGATMHQVQEAALEHVGCCRFR